MRVGVTASAEKGKANAAIVKLLSRALKLHASDILVVRGATGRQKSILFRNGNVAELNKKVSALYKDWSDRSKRAKREP